MPASTKGERPLGVGEEAAVEILYRKIMEGSGPEKMERERLLDAVEHARKMHEGVVLGVEDPQTRAFYHGLLTGYSVALQLMEREHPSH